MGRAVIKNNYIKYNGKRYFKAGSDGVTITKFGSKKEPLTQANYLLPYDDIPTPKLSSRINTVSIVEVDTASTKKSNFLANISSFMGIFGVSGDVAWQKIKSGEYVFVLLTVDMVDLRKAYNQAPKALNEFADVPGKERAVCEVLIALEANEAEAVVNSSSFGLEMTNGKINVTASGGTSGKSVTTTSISPGTVYGYMLAKPKWKSKKSSIDHFTDDQHGPN